MRKIILISFFFIAIATYAQEEQLEQEEELEQEEQEAEEEEEELKTKFWDNVRFGGGLGLAFGSNQTTFAISPSAIYQFSDMFGFGLGTSYLYSKSFDFKSNVYGISLISLFNPFEQIQFSAEFEQLFVTQKLRGFEDNNFNYPAMYLGIAYRQGWFSAGIRYDVLYDVNKNIYASPWSPIIRIYF